jgi:hypothetical protein
MIFPSSEQKDKALLMREIRKKDEIKNKIFQ